MQDIDIGQITEALNDKMDLDSVNANPAVAKQSDLATLQNTVSQLQATVTSLQGAIASMSGKIDYSSKVEGTLTSNKNSNASYTIPADGFILVTNTSSSGTGTKGRIRINNIIVSEEFSDEATISKIAPTVDGYYTVSKNDVVLLEYAPSGTFAIGSVSISYRFYAQKS